MFDDPALQALVREALANNLDLQMAVARVEEARARAGIAKSFLYPQVDGVASYSVRQASSTSNGTARSDDDTTHQSGTYGFQLSWEIDLFGRLRRQHEAALALVLASEQGRRGVLVTLVGDVATNYFLLRELDLQLEIARQTLRLNDETVTYFQNRLDGGVSNRLELDRIQANRAPDRGRDPADRAADRHRRERAVAAARPSAGAGRRVSASPTARPLPPPIPAGLPASLIERRPDVVAGGAVPRGGQRRHRRGQGAVLSDDQPDRLSRRRQRRSHEVPRRRRRGVVGGPGLLQPIFQAGRLRRNLEATQARFDEALAAYRKAALNGYREVANALVTIQKLAEMRVQRQVGVTALQDASDLARARYDSGLASYIEILTADQELFQQQLLLAQTRGAELRARAELYRTLGGGWQP